MEPGKEKSSTLGLGVGAGSSANKLWMAEGAKGVGNVNGEKTCSMALTLTSGVGITQQTPGTAATTASEHTSTFALRPHLSQLVAAHGAVTMVGPFFSNSSTESDADSLTWHCFFL